MTVLALGITSTTPVMASGDPVDGVAVAVPDGSIPATPEEVAVLGGSNSEVEEQRALWEALPADVRAEQIALSAEPAGEFAPAFENIVETPGLLPRISPSSCVASYAATAYKVAVNGDATQWFSGSAGTYTLASKMKDVGGTGDARVQACSHKGRIYYPLNNGHYWSKARGPNGSKWRHFNISYDHIMTVLGVQFL